MLSTLQQCREQLEGIQAIDYYLAREICQALEQTNELLFHSIMLTLQLLRNGHSCLKIDQEADTLYWQHSEDEPSGYIFPAVNDWHQLLSELAISPADNQPLVYEQQRLYLRRYWQFEQELAERIRALIDQKNTAFDSSQAGQVIEQLFPDAAADIDWQKVAVANALSRQFTIIAGGPGTGKTFTVIKILAALQILAEGFLQAKGSLKIAMVAPTGKAAQRLNESIQNTKSDFLRDKLLDKTVLNTIPDTAGTVHRLLGVIPGSHDFRYNQDRSLPYDVILVDEISMIDLPLMTRLMRAVKSNCRIIMLGDADQLPSVAAGSVLSDLAPRQEPGYSPDTAQQLNDLTGFKLPQIEPSQRNLDHLSVLQKSRRFDGSGEIGRLATAVIKGDAEQSWHVLQQGKKQIEALISERFYLWLDKLMEQFYSPLFTDNIDINSAFAQLKKFRFLAATRLGEQGVININNTIEQALRKKGLISSSHELYPGRPIMVTENHYGIGLYNGDTGLLWPDKEGKLQAVFPQNDSLRWLSLGRLPKVETVYAMTIHKTQGSEFNHVALVLPENDSLVLSRELLYTAITRAKDKLSVFGSKGIFKLGVTRKVQRYSGLQEKVFANR